MTRGRRSDEFTQELLHKITYPKPINTVLKKQAKKKFGNK